MCIFGICLVWYYGMGRSGWYGVAVCAKQYIYNIYQIEATSKTVLEGTCFFWGGSGGEWLYCIGRFVPHYIGEVHKLIEAST